MFGQDPRQLGLSVIYDVCHDAAVVERQRVNGEWLELVVHRTGATRAFGSGAPDLPEAYGDMGQPVIIGGSIAPRRWACFSGLLREALRVALPAEVDVMPAPRVPLFGELPLPGHVEEPERVPVPMPLVAGHA